MIEGACTGHTFVTSKGGLSRGGLSKGYHCTASLDRSYRLCVSCGTRCSGMKYIAA